MKIVLQLLVISLAVALIHCGCSENRRKHANKAKIYSKMQRDCRLTTGVSQDIINQARRGNFTEDEILQQHLYCLSKKLGYQDESGKLRKDFMKEKFQEMIEDYDKLDTLFSECVKDKETPESTAWHLMKCFRENADINAFEEKFFRNRHLNEVRRYNRNCLTESKLDNKTLENAKLGNIEETEALDNHLFCLFKKLGYQNELGEIQSNKIRKDMGHYVDDDTIEDIVKMCAVNEDTPQLTAFNYYKCSSNNSPFDLHLMQLF